MMSSRARDDIIVHAGWRCQSTSAAATPRANRTLTTTKRLQAQRRIETPSIIDACGHLTHEVHLQSACERAPELRIWYAVDERTT
jgi:hypothetical protein